MTIPENKPDYRPAHIADALEIIAKANHYMVGITNPDDYSSDEFDAAEQVLIERQNKLNQYGEAYRRRNQRRFNQLELALDLCKQYRAEACN
jgi:hypothetical protein